jgi:hypothetical protein
MIDEVDSLHVKRNTLSGLLQFSYYRYWPRIGKPPENFLSKCQTMGLLWCGMTFMAFKLFDYLHVSIF